MGDILLHAHGISGPANRRTYVHDLPWLVIQLPVSSRTRPGISDLRETARPSRVFSIYCWVGRRIDEPASKETAQFANPEND